MPDPVNDVLDEVAALAALEHASIVYYLRLTYAMTGVPETPAGLRTAAEIAGRMWFEGMFHLRDANRALVTGGRDPVLDRVDELPAVAGSTPVRLRPVDAAAFSDFPKREKALAAAIEARYDRVGAVVTAPPTGFPDDLLGSLEILLGNRDHCGPVGELADALHGLAPSQYLLVTGTKPDGALDDGLLELSDGAYTSVQELLRLHFTGQPTGIRPDARMDELNRINQLLVLRGLLPPFS